MTNRPEPHTLHEEPHPKTKTLDSGAITFTILVEAYTYLLIITIC